MPRTRQYARYSGPTRGRAATQRVRRVQNARRTPTGQQYQAVLRQLQATHGQRQMRAYYRRGLTDYMRANVLRQFMRVLNARRTVRNRSAARAA